MKDIKLTDSKLTINKDGISTIEITKVNDNYIILIKENKKYITFSSDSLDIKVIETFLKD